MCHFKKSINLTSSSYLLYSQCHCPSGSVIKIAAIKTIRFSEASNTDKSK